MEFVGQKFVVLDRIEPFANGSYRAFIRLVVTEGDIVLGSRTHILTFEDGMNIDERLQQFAKQCGDGQFFAVPDGMEAAKFKSGAIAYPALNADDIASIKSRVKVSATRKEDKNADP